VTEPWIAALIALFAWWFSTGAILAVVKRADGGGRKSHLWAVLLALPVLVLGAGLFVDTLHRTEPFAVFAAFLAALMIWGWIEMAFLCGIVTGPNRALTPEGVSGWERFRRAWWAVAWHELLLLAALVAMGWAAQGAANPFGFVTFAVLFGARVSAKLNLFWGVPRINTEFLPEAIAYLPTHFRVGRPNAIYPLTVAALAGATALLLREIGAADAAHAALGWTLAAAIAGLALIEHLLMVVPLPDQKLWRWMLPEPRDALTQTQTSRPREPAE
jgi:putative photosynthetic complex assembly protein 2